MGVVPVHEQANDSNLSTGSGVVNRLMIGRVDCAYTRQVVDCFTVAKYSTVLQSPAMAVAKKNVLESL